jgi:hypothetical protein
MKEETRTWISYADENLDVAGLAFDHGHLNACLQNAQLYSALPQALPDNVICRDALGVARKVKDLITEILEVPQSKYQHWAILDETHDSKTRFCPGLSDISKVFKSVDILVYWQDTPTFVREHDGTLRALKSEECVLQAKYPLLATIRIV